MLKVENHRVWFNTAHGVVRAVDGVSFELGAGETLGIVGESGSGKSVLARSLMKLLPTNVLLPEGGRVCFEGRDLADLSPIESKHFWGTRMAMVFQDPMTSLNPVRKIEVQVTDSLRYHLRLGKRDARQRAVALLDEVGITEPERRLSQYPHELSGGMRQRILIAIALACEPKLLIADEPTTALDVTVQRQILDLLARLREERGMAMILITHDLGVVGGETDRVAVMYAGRFLEVSGTDELFETMRHPYTEALLNSIPQFDQPSHEPLDAIAGRPPDMTNPPTGCTFASRCRYCQPQCLAEEPALAEGDDGVGHAFRCFFPVGTPEGKTALANNVTAGRTAAGLPLAPEVMT